MTKYLYCHFGVRLVGLFTVFISNYRESLSALTGIGPANFMDSEAVIKKEVSGRFNSLGVFRGFIRL